MVTDPLDGYPAMMSAAEVAEYTGIDAGLLAKWRHADSGPPYVKMSPGRNGIVRYPREALRAYLAERTRAVSEVTS